MHQSKPLTKNNLINSISIIKQHQQRGNTSQNISHSHNKIFHPLSNQHDSQRKNLPTSYSENRYINKKRKEILSNVMTDSGHLKVQGLIKTVVASSQYYKKDHEVIFNFKFFFQSIIIHLLFQTMLPLMLIIFVCCVNKNRLYNQGFLGCHYISIFEYFNYIGNVTLAIIYVIFKPSHNLQLIYVLMSANLVRMFVISIRYGYTVKQRLKLMNAKKLSRFQLMKQFILVGWLHFEPIIIESEIQSAFTRQMIQPFSFSFTFIDDIPEEVQKKFSDKYYYQKNKFQLKKYVKQLANITHLIECQMQNELNDKFLEKRKHKINPEQVVSANSWKVGGGKSITIQQLKQNYCGFCFARELLLYSLKNNNWVFILSRVISIVLTLIPVVLHFVDIGFKTPNWPQAAFLLFFMLSCFLIFQPNIAFILVGAVDLERKVFLLKCLTKMISPTLSTKFQFTKSSLIPTMDISSEMNYYNWLKLRQILLDVGKKFTSRIFLYMGFYVAGILIVFLLFILDFLKVLRIEIPLTLRVYLCCIAGLIFYMLLIFLFKGAQINQFFEEHLTLLKEMKMNIITSHLHDCDEFFKCNLRTAFMIKMREIYRIVGCERKEKEEKLLLAIDNVIESLDHQQRVNKIRFLGIEMTYGVLKGFFGFIFSLVIAFLASRFGIE